MSEIATFGAGCFWGIEANFRRVPGVLDAVSGYSGGHMENPSYKDVCTDETGHAEVVQVTFDPARVSYEKLLGDVLADARSDAGESAGAGFWIAVSVSNFLSFAGAGSDGEEVEGGLWMRAENSVGRSRRKSRLRGRSIVPRSITSDISRSAA